MAAPARALGTAPPTVVAGTPPPAAAAFTGLIALYPIAWALGLAPIVWAAVAVPMTIYLLKRPNVLVPRAFMLWLVFLVVVFASFLQVNSAGRIATWGLRTVWYVAATVCVVYLVNQPGRAAVRSIVRALVGFWLITMVGGWAGLLAPDVAWAGLFAKALPGVIRANSLVADLTEPAFTEIQRVGGNITLRRPAAPFAYTNNWGSTFALLTPFVLLAAADRRYGIPRSLAFGLLAVGSVPFALALNRGSWLTLGIGLVYAGWLLVRKGNPRVVLGAIVFLLLALVAAAGSGAIGVVSGQLEARSTDSNETRAALIEETIHQTMKSPLIGYGTPRPSPEVPDGPPVGTHGQMWMVMFSHGMLGVACYIGFFLYFFLATEPSNTTLVWCKVAMLIGLTQTMIYGHLPHQLFIMMATVAAIHHAAEPEPS